MRNKKFLLIVVLFIGWLVILNISVSAMNTGISTRALTEKETEAVQIKSVLLTEEPARTSIKCFDVNENGSVALVLNSFETTTIGVYTLDGKFQYGHLVGVNSRRIGIEWDHDNLIIYTDLAVEVNPHGEIEEIRKIEDTTDNVSYLNKVRARIKNFKNQKLVAKNDMGILNGVANSYSQLVLINEMGEERIIYDANTNQLVKYLTGCFIILIFFFIGMVVVLKIVRKVRQGTFYS